MYLLFKNSFNLYHPVCMTESFRNVSVYAETLKWLWICFLFSALKHHVYFNLLAPSSASLACHNNFRNKIYVTVCNGRNCVRIFWATINKSSEANWTARTEQTPVPLLPAAATTPVHSSTFPQPAQQHTADQPLLWSSSQPHSYWSIVFFSLKQVFLPIYGLGNHKNDQH